MKKITNEQIIKKLESLQKVISNKEKMEQINFKEISEKINTTIATVNKIQDTIPVKETMRKLFNENIKAIVMSYAVLAIAYLGIGFTAVLSSMKFIDIQYGIIFAAFFGGSIILAYLGYLKKKELDRWI